MYELFSLRMAVLLHKWEFKNIEVEFLKWVKTFDHEDFQILEPGSHGTSWFWQLVQALILAILVDLLSPMIYAKITQGILGSGEEDFYLTYGHGGHFGQRTATILATFPSPNLRRLQMKFEQNWHRGFRGEVVWKCGWTITQTDDGPNVTTIAHPEHSSGELKKHSTTVKLVICNALLVVGFLVMSMLDFYSGL